MSAPLTWGSERGDAEMRAARAAGWRRRDLIWERWQERANRDLAAGRRVAAFRGFRRALWLARLSFDRGDPRWATSLANAAFAARDRGAVRRAARLYARAIARWERAPAALSAMQIKPRARSSLFHLRMEARHWDTYRANLERRLRGFHGESASALEALARGGPAPCRLHERWRGEKPSVFDDTRKFLAACLLIVSEPR